MRHRTPKGLLRAKTDAAYVTSALIGAMIVLAVLVALGLIADSIQSVFA